MNIHLRALVVMCICTILAGIGWAAYVFLNPASLIVLCYGGMATLFILWLTAIIYFIALIWESQDE